MLLAYQFFVEAAPITPADRVRLERALEAFDKGESDEPAKELEELAQRYPDQFEINETLGLIYAGQGELGRALPLLEAAHKVDPASPEATANLGVAYLKLNRTDDAVATLGQAVLLDASNAETQNNYGHALMGAKKPDLAARAFARAAAEKPGDSETLYNWALAEFEAGHVNAAGDVLDKISPVDRGAQVESLCGDIEEKRGHPERAVGCFEAAAKLDGSEHNVYSLGLELLRHWSFEPAEKVFQYGISQYPSSEKLRTGLGLCFYADSKYDVAIPLFSALLRDNSSASAAKYLGLSCMAQKDGSEDDCGALTQYALDHPADLEAGELAAEIIVRHHQEGQFTTARKLLEAAARGPLQAAEAYYLTGVLDQEEGKWAESIGALQRAQASWPNSSKVHLRLALAYARSGNKDGAHAEAALEKQLKQAEDADRESQRNNLRTFVLTMR